MLGDLPLHHLGVRLGHADDLDVFAIEMAEHLADVPMHQAGDGYAKGLRRRFVGEGRSSEQDGAEKEREERLFHEGEEKL